MVGKMLGIYIYIHSSSGVNLPLYLTKLRTLKHAFSFSHQCIKPGTIQETRRLRTLPFNVIYCLLHLSPFFS